MDNGDVATSADHGVIPLRRKLYSSADPSHRSQNRDTLDALLDVLPFVDSHGLWVVDRGFDRGRLIDWFDGRGLRWLIRQRGDRHIWLPLLEQKFPSVDIAQALRTAHTARPLFSRDNVLTRIEVSFGACTVQRTAHGERLTLIAVQQGKQEQPMILLSNVRVRR